LIAVHPDGSSAGSVPAGRASLLVQRLAAASGTALSVDTIIDALWPKGAPATANRTVASLVSRVRSALGPDVIDGNTTRGYRFNLGSAWTTDVTLAERLVNEAQSRSSSAPALAAASAHRGLDMLDRGVPVGLASDVDAEWADDFTRHVAGLRKKLQRSLWDADIALGRWSELVDQAEAALIAEPHDEIAGRALMLAHWNRGDRGSALTTHDRMRARLLAELGVEPSPETEELYSAIVKDEHVNAIVRSNRGPAVELDHKLAGRDHELGLLVEAWNRTAAGTVVTATVSGPTGSGRSKLCAALADIVERTGGHVLQSVSVEGERSLFLHPILTMIKRVVLSTPADDIPAMLESFLGPAAELIPELRQVCKVEPYQRSSADLEHRRALQTVEHVLRSLATHQPLLLVFDDIHHAGASTVEALHWLQTELESLPVLIVTTMPPDHGNPQLLDLVSRSTHIELRPLSEPDVAALATAAGRPEDAGFVWELTQGHLLFVQSVLEALSRDVQRASIPDSLRSVVFDSIRQAGPDVHNVLQVAAVIGMTFDLRTLAHVTERQSFELIPLLESAIGATLVQTRDDLFEFSNRVIQEVLYDASLGPIRREQHRRLAELLASRPERRAWHLAKAGDVDAAANAWLEAALLARRTFSNSDADRLFTEALNAAELADNNLVRGEALIGRGMARTELGQYGAASDDQLEAERLSLSTGNRALRARAVERLGWIAYYERDVAAAIARAEEAATMPGAHPSAWVLLGRTRHWAGDFDEAATAYNRALDELDDEDRAVRASALSCLGALLAHSDRFPEAIDVLDESVALCHEIGAFRPLLRSLFFEGLARANSGDLSGALTTFETKKTLLHRYDVSFYRARTNTCLAWIWRELGEHGRAQTLSEQALAESREVDEGELQVEQELHALCSLAECAMIADKPDAAAEFVSDARALLGGWLPFRWRAELRATELATRLGVESPERLLVDARTVGSGKYEALALHLLGRTEEAGRVAAATGSHLLLAEVALPEQAAQASTKLISRLPRQLREGFETRGRLSLDRT